MSSCSGSSVRRSCDWHTNKLKLQRKHQPSFTVMHSVSPSVKPYWNACSCQSSWTAACPLTLPSQSLCQPLPQLQILLMKTQTGPWNICDNIQHQLQSLRQHWRHELKRFPKSHRPSRDFTSALAHRSRPQPEPYPPKLCLCSPPSLTSSSDLLQLKPGTARWGGPGTNRTGLTLWCAGRRKGYVY